MGALAAKSSIFKKIGSLAVLPGCSYVWALIYKRGSLRNNCSVISRYNPWATACCSSRNGAAAGRRPDSGGTETSQVPRKGSTEEYLALLG